MRMSPRRPGTVTTLMSGALILLVISTLVLWSLVLKPPAKARFEVGRAQGGPCQPGDRATACYTFSATNIGGATASMRCVVEPAQGTTALFRSDLPTYVDPYPISPGTSENLTVKVNADDGGTAGAPTVSCSPT